MTTEKQVIANQQNALASTGPATLEGKAIVAANPIKHGIFTKDIMNSSTYGSENKEEYHEMLSNLRETFCPQNQMESLLVEKIAIDFWRLRRVLRFEVGSIFKYTEALFNELYSCGRKKNCQIDMEIKRHRDYINWIDSYVECLKSNQVNFDKQKWVGEGIESNIRDDLYLLINSLTEMPYKEKESLCYDASFAQQKETLRHYGYFSNTVISEKLIELYAQEKERSIAEIADLEEQKPSNVEADKLILLLGAIPNEENTDKILKYERSLQKSIFQNVFLLRKLQGSF